jgi:hypothetical protein
MSRDPVTAYHEAAHSVVARVVGLRLAHATIDGRPHVRSLHRSDDGDALFRLGVTDLAATFGEPDETARATDERRAYGRAQRIVLGRMAFDEAYDGLPAATEAVVAEMREVAERLMRQNMGMVERVAAELLRLGKLDQRQVDAVMRAD